MKIKIKRKFISLTIVVLAVCMIFAGCGTYSQSGSSITPERSSYSSQTSSMVNTDTSSVTGKSSSAVQTSSKSAATSGKSSPASSSQKSPAVSSSSSGTASKPGGTSTPSTAATFAPMGANVMPVGAWVSPPPPNLYGNNNPNFITQNNFRLAKEAGINILYSLYERMEINPSYVMQALDAAQANGMKYLVSDSNVQAGVDDKELMDSALSKYKDHPAFLGNLMLDEPSTKHFDFLGDIHDNYRASLPDKIYYINLLPTYASKNQLFIDKGNEGGGKPTKDDYRRYLDEFVEKVNPRFISYDYYPCMGSFPKLENDYFVNMSIVREVCQQENIPFWVFIQSASWNSNVRIPNLSETLWQVNTALSYGAQGVQYFTYWIPLEKGDWKGGMIDKNGNKTEVYDYVKQANKQLAAVDHVLMNSKSKGVIVSGNSPVQVPAQDQMSSYKELKAVTGVPSITGCFDYNGKSAFYVTNNSITTDGKIVLAFTRNVTVSVYQDGVKTSKSASQIELNTTAGSGSLVVIEK